MSLVKHYYDYPKKVLCPILIIQGENDDLVPTTSAKYVYDTVNSKVKKLVFVKSATHDIFKSKNRLEIYNLIEDFLKKITKGGVENI